MLDIKWIRSNPEDFKKAMIKRGEASPQHPANAKILEQANTNPEDRAAVLQTFLNNSSAVVIEKIQPLEELDEKRRQAIFTVESLKAERNAVSKEVGRRKANKEPAEDLLAGMKEVSDKIKNLEKDLEEIDQTMNDLLMTIPNVPSQTAPVGHDESANLEVRKYGNPREYSFAASPVQATRPHLLSRRFRISPTKNMHWR